jgi:hypothetical protein
MPSTAAQDEFDALIFGTGKHSPSRPHTEDLERHHSRSSSNNSSLNGDKSSRDLEKRALRAGRSQPDSDYEDEASDYEGGQALGPRKNGKMRTRYYIPSTRSEANTGPKGVIADAQAFEQARRAHRSVASLAVTNTVQYNAPLSDKSSRPAGKQHSRAGSWLMEADEDEDSDDDFMTRWRQSRLRELAKRSGPHGYIGRRSRSGQRYGSLVGVDAEGYLDAVEKTKSETVVCVFIYDDAVSSFLLPDHSFQEQLLTYLLHSLRSRDSLSTP